MKPIQYPVYLKINDTEYMEVSSSNKTITVVFGDNIGITVNRDIAEVRTRELIHGNKPITKHNFTEKAALTQMRIAEEL